MDRKKALPAEEPVEGQQESKVTAAEKPVDLRSCGGGFGREEEK